MSREIKSFLYNMAIVGLVILAVCSLGNIADSGVVLSLVATCAFLILAKCAYVSEKRLHQQHKSKAKVTLRIKHEPKAVSAA